MDDYTPRPAEALDAATPLPERLEALARWWDAESARLMAAREGVSREVAVMRKQRGYQYSLCAADLRAVAAVSDARPVTTGPARP